MASRIRFKSAWVWLITASLAVALITALTVGRHVDEQPLSSSSSLPDGTLAAYKWLGSIGYHPSRHVSFDLSNTPPGTTTIFLLQSDPNVGSQDVRRLERWVQNGGILVVSPFAGLTGLMHRLGLSASYTGPAPVAIAAPILGRPPAKSLAVQADAIVQGRPKIVAAASRFGNVLVEKPFGSGATWVLTAPQVLDNAHLSRADNSTLLVALAGPRGRNLEFTELPFRAAASAHTTNWLTGFPWGIAALFATAILLAYRLTSGWRLGPPVKNTDEGYRPATDFVLAMAGLLRQGRKRQEALQVFQEQLRRRSDRGDDRDSERVDRLLTVPPHLTDQELVRRVREIVDLEPQDPRADVLDRSVLSQDGPT